MSRSASAWRYMGCSSAALAGSPPSLASTVRSFSCSAADALLRAHQVDLGFLELDLGRDAPPLELALALGLLRVELHALPRLLDLRLDLAKLGARGFDVVAHREHLRLGHVERDLERLRVEAEQDVAVADELVFRDPDRDHATIHVRADRHHVRLDVRVLGRHVAAGHGVPVEAEQAGDAGTTTSRSGRISRRARRRRY